MIRILHIVTYMGRGGLETMIMNYYRNIDRTKIQFDFLVHRDFEADYDSEIRELGGVIYRLPRLNPFSKDYLDTLRAFFKEHKEYKIVHSHLDCMSGIPSRIAKECGVPVRIAHAHSSSQTKDSKYLLKLLFKRKIAKVATDLFACGEKAGQWMFGTDCFHVLNNAIKSQDYTYSKEMYSQKRQELNIPEEAFVIGHVGRFAPPKNHDFIIDVFDEVKKQNPNAYLLLVGDGELRVGIKEKAEKLGLKNSVCFAGLRSDVNELLQAMDVFLFPSIYEGLPVSIVEAQAAGLPCFISDKVPIECKKTDLVQQFSLETSAKEWADSILKVDITNRRDTSDEIKQAGFDIVENAKWLENYYIKKSMELRDDD